MLALAGAAAMMAVISVQATPITGSISMAGSLSLDTSDVWTATTVENWGSTVVTGVTPIFSSYTSIGSAVSMTGPWTFAPNPGNALSGLWSVGGFTFSVNTDTVGYSVTGGYNTTTVVGHGTISGNGYDTTAFDWILSTQNPASGSIGNYPQFSFSASTALVPDGGATVMLLGAALSAMGLLRKKLTA